MQGKAAETLPGRANRLARALDRYLGVPLVLGVSACRRPRPVPPHPKTLGLLNTAALGDTILMSGPVADLRAQYPDASITLLSGPSNYEVARLMSHVDHVVRLPIFDPFASLRLLRACRFDVVLDFGPWCRLNALLTILSGAEFAIGFRTGGQARHFGYDLAVEHSPRVHELENHRRIVRALGVQTSHLPSLPLAPGTINAQGPFEQPYVVCHLWPGGSAARQKEWPAVRWVALIEHFARCKYQVVLTGSPNQKDLNQRVISEVDEALRDCVHNAAGSSLSESLIILKGASLAVSVDTGLVHMAAALDVPLVALYGPTSAERWGPISNKAIIVGSPLASAGYLSLGFERLRNPPPCMEAICYESVEAACNAALGPVAQDNSMRRGSRSPLWSGRLGNWTGSIGMAGTYNARQFRGVH